ncbi:MAG: hypothetical protein R2748_26560 [Bryobacterales bacterium]
MVRGFVVALALAAPLVAQAPLRSRAAQSEPTTFHRDVERILQKHCQGCHRPGEVAPFSLLDYESAWLFSRHIRTAIKTGYMPPWKPVRDEGVKLQFERGLSEAEIATITRWVDQGAPEGDPADAPEPLTFQSGWPLGEPDMVLEMPAEYAPDKDGADDYRCFSLAPNLPEKRKIRAIAVEPGNRAIVHHVLLFPDPQAQSASLHDPGDPQPGYTCFGDPGYDPPGFYGGWVPGNTARALPDGVAMTLEGNARIALQVHYHPDGTQQTDRTRIGIYFTNEPNPKELLFLPLVDQRFLIPAGAEGYEVTASFAAPLAARIYALLPHMHLLGREISLELSRGGETQTVIRIDDWDFDWQDTYWLEEPLLVPALTRATLRCVYDNSAANPNNPNHPPKDVGWGEKTTDEMALMFVAVTLE